MPVACLVERVFNHKYMLNIKRNQRNQFFFKFVLELAVTPFHVLIRRGHHDDFKHEIRIL